MIIYVEEEINQFMQQQEEAHSLFPAFIQMAVPKKILEYEARGGPTDDDFEHLRTVTCTIERRGTLKDERGKITAADNEIMVGLAEIVGVRGDILMYGSKDKKENKSRRFIFDETVNGVAVASFCPGGVSLFGYHYYGEAPGVSHAGDPRYDVSVQQREAQRKQAHFVYLEITCPWRCGCWWDLLPYPCPYEQRYGKDYNQVDPVEPGGFYNEHCLTTLVIDLIGNGGVRLDHPVYNESNAPQEKKARKKK